MGTTASIPVQPLPKAVAKPINNSYSAAPKNFVEKRHRVVIVGINYPRTDCRLSGCINDAVAFDDFMNKRALGAERPIETVFLRDDQPGDFYPTRENILRALRWAYSTVPASEYASSNEYTGVHEEGTVVTFYYSGHGSYVRDRNGDEEDGRDETLCPVAVDGQFDDMIVDDELRGLLGPLITSNTYSVFITDCCHSGSVFDLEYKFNGNRFVKRGKYIESAGPVLHFSACYDYQTAQEGNVCGVRRGYFTNAFITVMKGNSRYDIKTLYRMLCTSMIKYISQREEMPQLSAGCVISAQSRVPF